MNEVNKVQSQTGKSNFEDQSQPLPSPYPSTDSLKVLDVHVELQRGSLAGSEWMERVSADLGQP